MAAPSPEQLRKRELLLRLAILYRIDRGQEKLGVIADTSDQAFINHVVNRMDSDDLLDPDAAGEYLRLTDKGRQALHEMVSVFDRTLQLNIFARVDIATNPPDGVLDEHGNVFMDLYDPRFGMPDDPATDRFIDMRLAMLTFLAETHDDGPQEFDPYLVVFLQKLIDGELVRANFWRDLRVGVIFTDIEAIVESAYQWRAIGDDEEDSIAKMRTLFSLGMAELRKREGEVCGNPECNVPLALYADAARERGEPHTACDCCGWAFGPPPDANLLGDCPRCQTPIYRGQHACRGCGAHVNVSLPPGTVSTERVTETVTETEEVWGHDYGYYGYTPVGYYDPYVYPGDLFLTGLVVGAILF